MQPVAGQGLAVEADFELRRSREHLHLGVGGAGDGIDDPEYVRPQAFEDRSVGPEDLHRHVRLDPGDDFVEAHRHRLGEVHRETGNLRQRGGQRVDQFLLGTPALPVVLGVEQHVDVPLVDAHRLGGEIRAAHLGDDVRDLVELGEQLPLDARRDLDGLLERHRRQLPGLDEDGPLVEARHELGSQEGDGADGGQDDHRRRAHGRGLSGQGDSQHSEVALPEPHEPTRLPVDTAELEQEGGDHRNAGQGEDERAEERRADRDGHRPEHLSLESLQRQDRQIDGDDDEHPEEHGTGDLHRRAPNERDPPAAFPGGGPAPHEALHHHHGAVHDETEVDGAEGHQVGRDPEHAHAREADQHREGDDRGDDERRPDVAEEEEQDEDDQQAALDEVPAHGRRGAVDDLALVVERLDVHPGREARQDLAHPLLHQVGHLESVLALQHDHHAARDLALATRGDRAAPLHRPQPDLGDVGEEHRDAVGGAHHHPFEVLNTGEQADPAHGVALVAGFDEPAAERAVAVADGVEHLPQGEVVLLERLRPDNHLELLGEAAPRVHLAHPGHRTQPGAHLPVMDRLVLHRVVAGDHVLVDLPERGRGRAQGGFEAGGHLPPDLGEPLGDELAGEIHVHRLVEDDGDQ